MDLLNLIPKDTFTIELKHPNTGEVITTPKGDIMTVDIYSPYSKKYQSALHEQADKRLKKNARKGQAQLTAQDFEKASLDMLVETIAGWRIFMGEDVPFSKEKAAEVLVRLPWIKQQILEAQDDQSNFFDN